MKPSKFSNVPRALLPALLLTIFMSSGSVARSIDEPPIDTFLSNDSRPLKHISELINERDTASAKISEEYAGHPDLDELSNKTSTMLLKTVKQSDIEELNSNIKNLIVILERKNKETDISSAGAELNKLMLKKSEINEALETQTAIEKDALFRSAKLAGHQDMYDVGNEFKELENLKKLSIKLEFYINCIHLFILSVSLILLTALIVYEYTPFKKLLSKLKK
ncbi:hypothetical protein [Klebsiella pneumoniae]|uniref:hypothetical protein n=1 Tax=Klebsiella pneumoniae TaxID=573 RepID=UPI00300866CC